MNDFNPGIEPSGLFWTSPVDEDTVEVSPGSGRARFTVEELETRDFHNIVNAISGGPSDPAEVSFDMRWSGNGRHVVQTDGSTFTYDSFINTATVEWSGVNKATGMRFRSDPASTSQTKFAAVGFERNGRFFH